MVVKAAEVKAVEDVERGMSVPQPKMTQTSKKVIKDLRMDLLFGCGGHKDNQDS